MRRYFIHKLHTVRGPEMHCVSAADLVYKLLFFMVLLELCTAVCEPNNYNKLIISNNY